MPPRICDCAGGLKGWARGSKGDCLGSKGDCFGLATGGEEALPTHAAPPLGLGGEATVGPPPLGGEGPGEATGGPSAVGGEATGGPSALGGESTGGALGVEPPTGGPEEELPWPTAAGGYLGVDDDSASAARAFAFLSSAAAISRLGC